MLRILLRRRGSWLAEPAAFWTGTFWANERDARRNGRAFFYIRQRGGALRAVLGAVRRSPEALRQGRDGLREERAGCLNKRTGCSNERTRRRIRERWFRISIQWVGRAQRTSRAISFAQPGRRRPGLPEQRRSGGRLFGLRIRL